MKALIYFEAISTLALLIGLVVVNVIQPGVGITADPASLDTAAVKAYANTAESLSTVPPWSSFWRAASSAFCLPSSSAVFFLANS